MLPLKTTHPGDFVLKMLLTLVAALCSCAAPLVADPYHIYQVTGIVDSVHAGSDVTFLATGVGTIFTLAWVSPESYTNPTTGKTYDFCNWMLGQTAQCGYDAGGFTNHLGTFLSVNVPIFSGSGTPSNFDFDFIGPFDVNFISGSNGQITIVNANDNAETRIDYFGHVISSRDFEFDPSAVPEPASMALMISGLGLFVSRKQRTR